ncbi:MAG: DNA repair protein RadC [Thermomicrobiales bacterium]|nr:DNA repair protein RadC [Thermomicrobiales bacterium]
MDDHRALGVKEMPSDDRPRERLLRHGPGSLSTSELLAVLLNTGSVGEPVTTLADRILHEFGGLRGLMRASVDDLAAVKGVGPAKAAKFAAALELAKRVVALGPDERPRITTPEDIVRLVGPEMGALDQEELRVILLDTRNRLIRTSTIYRGSVSQAQVRVGEVFREAVRVNAASIAVVHNHPSGECTPSAADVALTAELERAGDLLDIDVLDHVIVGAHGHLSLRRARLGFKAAKENRGRE